MTLEDAGGKSQGLIVPYAKSAMDAFTFGDPTAALDNPRIFFVDNGNHFKQ
jgi:hypothetical protein